MKESIGDKICVKCGKKTFRNHRGIGICKDCMNIVQDLRDKFLNEALTFEKNGSLIKLDDKFGFNHTFNISFILNMLISKKDPEIELNEFKAKKN